MQWGGLLEGEKVRDKELGKEWESSVDRDVGEGGRMNMGSGEEYSSTKGVIFGITGDLIIYGIPGPRRDPQIVLWTEERVPEPALAHNHTDEYFTYHHRSFIW